MPRLSPKVMLVIAVLLSLATAGLVYSYLQRTTQGQGEQIVVAVSDIPGRTVITAQMVKTVNVPAELMQPGAIGDINKAVGSIAKVPIMAGDQITESRVAIEGRDAGFIGLIPRDKRAFTIEVNDITGVAGFVTANDYVDVILAFDKSVAGENVSRLLLQNVLVLAANRSESMEISTQEKKNAEKMVSVTLAVSPEEASILTLAAEKGKLHLALRPFQSGTEFNDTKTFIPEDLVGRYGQSTTQFGSTGSTVTSVSSTTVSSSGIEVIRGTKLETVSVK